MKKYRLIFIAVALFVLDVEAVCFAAQMEWVDVARGNRDIKAILVDAQNPSVIYMGAKNSVFASRDGGKNWRNILSVKGTNRLVNFLFFHPADKKQIYAATAEGLFFTNNQGASWKRIFRGKNEAENNCTSLAVFSQSLYLGTACGLFISNNHGRNWNKLMGELGNAHILAITGSLKEPNCIYAASTGGVFKTEDAGGSWKKIFLRYSTDSEPEKEGENEDQDEVGQTSEIRYIALDPNNLNYLYLASTKGVYQSQDRGENWNLLSDYGLLSKEIRFILVSDKSHIYLVSKAGIFEYRNNRWQELSFNLVFKEVRFLTFDHQDNLYVASDNGLFKTETNSLDKLKQDNINTYYENDPRIEEVQRAAIRYAEVEPEKIKHWRKQAAKKAFLPKVSAGVGRNTSDLWHWESGSSTKAGDDILIRGRDSVDWDLRLSWDLGEIIWNDDQTSIDVRSRLTVQLREDILDEVIKLYFERIRVKMELDNLGIEDRKKRFEKELKLQELTAQLNGLTGGYFSSQIKKKF